MKRTDAFGATLANKFTNGNPPNTPATVVDDTWLNQVQEELCSVVEYTGVALDDAQEDQLLSAINYLIHIGGNNQSNLTIANNTGSPTNVGFSVESSIYHGMKIPYTLERKTATQSKQSMGCLYVVRNSFTNAWRITREQFFDDDDGVVFSITSGGQIQYTSDDLTGGTYSGLLRVTGYLGTRSSL